MSISSNIEHAIIGEDTHVQSQFIAEFGKDIPAFVSAMTTAYKRWEILDHNPSENADKAHLSAFVYMAINHHIQAQRLFFSGLHVPSGHMERQVIEAIAMALLSSDKTLPYLSHFMSEKYSTSKAIGHIAKQRNRLGISAEFVTTLRKTYDFYGKYSHLTLITLAHSLQTHNGKPTIAFGPTFDRGILHLYKQEMRRRVSLAVLFPDIVKLVQTKWEST